MAGKIRIAKLLYEPLEILHANWIYDGGSLIVAVTDSAGCLVQFCFDRRLQTETRGRIYLGTGGPADQDARLTSIAEEQRLIALLRAVVDYTYPQDVQLAIVEKDYRKVALTEKAVWEILRELRARDDLEAR